MTNITLNKNNYKYSSLNTLLNKAQYNPSSTIYSSNEFGINGPFNNVMYSSSITNNIYSNLNNINRISSTSTSTSTSDSNIIFNTNSMSPSTNSMSSTSTTNEDWFLKGESIVGNDNFEGFSVSLNGAGNIVASGAVLKNNTGEVNIYKFENTNWTIMGNPISFNQNSSYTGYSISLSNDGYRIAIGAPYYNNDNGIVRVFEYKTDKDEWEQLGNDLIGENGEECGISVSLSDDGNILAVGCPCYSNIEPELNKNGRVKLFNFNNNNDDWDNIGEISGNNNGDKTGFSVSLSGNGLNVAIGSIQNHLYYEQPGNIRVSVGEEGIVQIFNYDDVNWIQKGQNIVGGAKENENGTSVSLNIDGSIVAMGEPYFSNQKGRARVYNYNDVKWDQIGKDIIGETDGDRCGFSVSLSVSLSDNVNIVSIGSRLSGNTDNGSVRIFKNNSNSNTWSQIGKTIVGNSHNNKGYSVSLSNNGNTLAIGAIYSPGTTDVYEYY